MVSLISERSINRIVARQCGGATKAKADELGGRAEGILAAHRDTGEAKVEVTGGRVDAFVWLVDEAALSIEYGRQAFTTDDGRRVGAMQGLYILHRTVGMR